MERNEIINNIIEVTGKTLLSSIPVGGALITNVWDAVKGNELRHRLSIWGAQIESKLSKIETTLDEISNDPKFVNAIVLTTEYALKTADDEKRNYLSNAVVNSIKCSIDESTQIMYLDMLSKYTVMHIQILEYLKDPRNSKFYSGKTYYTGSPMQALLDSFSCYSSSKEIISKVIKDLYNDGLIKSDNLNISVTGDGMLASRTTKFGNDFLNFILKE